MKKRLLAAVLCAVMTLALLPGTAQAAASIHIGGMALGAGQYYVNGGSIHHSDPGSWNAHFDGTTLYLNDLALAPTDWDGACGIEISGGDITLDLAGNSSVSIAGEDAYFSAALYAQGVGLTVQGSGSLTAESNQSYGIVAGDLTMNGGTLTGDGNGDICFGIECADLVVTDGKLTGDGDGNGVRASSIDVSGGEVTGFATSGQGLFCKGLLSVSGGKVRGKGNAGIAVGENGVSPQPGAVEITGGHVIGEGGSNDSGLFAASDVSVSISGGVAEFTGGSTSSTGISVPQNGSSLAISGGTVKCVGTFRAVFKANNSSFSVRADSGYSAVASTNADGSLSEVFDTAKVNDYKYFRYAPGYAIALYDSGGVPLTAYTFPTRQVGDGGVPPLEITVKNTGANDTGALSVAIAGAGFTAAPTGIDSIGPDASETFEVSPNAALTAGTYNATVTVSNANVTESFAVQFTVTAPEPVITNPTANKTVPVTVGNTGTLSVTATGATGYQWWIYRSSRWVGIEDATGASYTTAPVTLANNGYRYYCTVTGAGGSVNSPIFTLNVTEGGDVPDTGDNAKPDLWLGVLLLAGAGLAASALLGRRKRKTENE